jgi:hypothetical protein
MLAHELHKKYPMLTVTDKCVSVNALLTLKFGVNWCCSLLGCKVALIALSSTLSIDKSDIICSALSFDQRARLSNGGVGGVTGVA